MAIFLDTTGQPTLGIGICARCKIKFPLGKLMSDPNYPGLMVCEKDADDFDPYRLPPRAPDQIALPFVRPDDSVATNPSGLIQEAGEQFIVTEGDERYIVI